MFSIIKLKNVTGNMYTVNGHEFQINEVLTIDNELRETWANSGEVETAITEENLTAYALDHETPLGIQTAIAYLKNSFKCTLAVDKNEVDQNLSGDGWALVTSQRVIWDTKECYDSENEDFVVRYDGVYFMDGQLKITDIVNCSSIELAVFKREAEEDDYWFILDKKIIQAETEVQLSAATSFDFYEGDKYCIKIKLNKVDPLLGVSATIEGSDDYTAWGYSFESSLW